MMQIIYHICAC